MTLAELNRLPRYRAEEELLKCCGSKAWARAMARRRPFANFDRLLAGRRRRFGGVWMQPTGWRLFAAHPRIGERKARRASDLPLGRRRSNPE